ncbi:hypothetical protein D6V35_17730, partial [Vibrio cholerae]|nr:hypothetical protein [Vibrio cholerae]
KYGSEMTLGSFNRNESANPEYCNNDGVDTICISKIRTSTIAVAVKRLVKTTMNHIGVLLSSYVFFMISLEYN